MSNPSKNKGTQFETDVVRYAQSNGFPYCERRALAGNLDKGDATLCPGIILEMKAWAEWSDGDIVNWQRETEREKKNANASIGILVVKRPRKNVAASYAYVVDEWGYFGCYFLADLLDKLRDQGWGSPRD